MKIKNIIALAGLAISLSVEAQPNPFYFNTAVDAAFTGIVGPLNTPDNNWWVSNTGITGTYVQARRCNAVTGWIAGTTNSEWITFPHTCNAAVLTESGCNPADEFYKINFNLTNATGYQLTLNMYADNCVYKVFVNNTTTPSYNSPLTLASAVVAGGYNSPVTTVVLNSGFVTGPNYIIVRLVSNNSMPADHTGLLVTADTSRSTRCNPCTPPSQCCLGNLCSASPNPLAGNYQIPMNNFNFNFTNSDKSKSQVLIGYPGCQSSSSRLDVKDDYHGTAIRGYCSNFNKNNVGVHGEAFDPTNGSNLTSVGVEGVVGRYVHQGIQIGVAGFCGGAANYPLPLTGQNIGVYGNSIANGGTWAGYFDGDVNINGNGLYYGSVSIASDKRFKTNIKPLDNVNDKLKSLKGYTYNYKTTEFASRNFPKTEQIGFIAQELKEVFPQLITETKDGYYAVNYNGFIPVLLQAVKEQQQQIDELKNLLQSSAGADKPMSTTSTPVMLSDKKTIVLNQNTPNPFAESTVISYNIPTDFTKAQIVFSTNEGKVIKTVNITEKGAGRLTVFADDLSHGIYSYVLVVDGKTMDTKKMIKE